MLRLRVYIATLPRITKDYREYCEGMQCRSICRRCLRVDYLHHDRRLDGGVRLP